MAAIPLLVPLQNPDIFWHLSAGRFIALYRAVPHQETFSFTFSGAPWYDFEWLTQLLYYGLYVLAGMPGLWLMKVALLAACGFVTLRTVKLYALGERWELAALVTWSAGALTHSDARPDLFSMLGVAVLLWMLERRRLQHEKWSLPQFAALLALFALWANLHAGFAFGLMLLGFYWAGAAVFKASGDGGRPRELSAGLAFAVAGTLFNPYGFGPYRVMAQHWLLRKDLTRFIQEWQPISFHNGYHWPIWPVMAIFFVLLFRQRKNKNIPLGLCAATLYFAYNAVIHARLASYFNMTVVVLIACLTGESGWLKKPRAGRALAAAALLYAGYLAWAMSLSPWNAVFAGRFVPQSAAEFLAREREAVAPLRVYNPWEWGGYLGWKLSPWYRVFSDGRYVFHPLLAEMMDADSEAGKCQQFFARYGVTGALLRNTDVHFPTSKLYADGKTKAFARPWYLFYMPREQWALVYWDAQALFFVDRHKVPKKWLESHEYRYVRPKDDEAFAEAVERYEIPLDRVKEEETRHRLEAILY